MKLEIGEIIFVKINNAEELGKIVEIENDFGEDFDKYYYVELVKTKELVYVDETQIYRIVIKPYTKEQKQEIYDYFDELKNKVKLLPVKYSTDVDNQLIK